MQKALCLQLGASWAGRKPSGSGLECPKVDSGKSIRKGGYDPALSGVGLAVLEYAFRGLRHQLAQIL